MQNTVSTSEAVTFAAFSVSSKLPRIFNLFLEPDVTILKNDDLIFAKLNALLSDIMLLGSPELVGLVGEYKVKVYEFHKQLTAKSDPESKETHKILVKLAGQIYDQMRKDLFITSKSAWIKDKETS